MRASEDTIPVIDLFAGPGGLGEGFSAYQTRYGARFRVALSIEKDPTAHATLLLRSFRRQFEEAPALYYDRLRGAASSAELYAAFPAQAAAARSEAIQLELGPKTRARTDRLVAESLRRTGGAPWVLVGGPPCQAYSLVGRSKMKGEDPRAYARDPRHYLYREYLRILERFRPPMFVMENVKGLLSSTTRGGETFREIIRDLQSAGYTLHSFVRPGTIGRDLEPDDLVIRSEDYGIPQCRHRVIVLGLRAGLERGRCVLAPQLVSPTIEDAIGDLPPIRSGVSGALDDFNAWLAAIRGGIRALPRELKSAAEELMRRNLPESLGAEFVECAAPRRSISAWLASNADWYIDERIGGVVHHSGRGHMSSDFKRYFFASLYAQRRGTSPRLKDFPKALLPAHRNVDTALRGQMFADRFRVQVGERPSTTIVSHICKDGHYYIHYDPAQCRSLTVREAARLQTFPDNYFFEGGRTAQYHQVGNAVPPLLASKMAEIVADVAAQLAVRATARPRPEMAVQ